MSWVGKNTAAILATTLCIALALISAIVPLSGAQGADTTPPVTTATVAGTPGDNGWYKKDTVTVTLAAIDNGSGVANTYYLIDGTQYPYTVPFTVAEGDYTGPHTLAYFSVDAVGNIEGAHLLSIKVDTTAPTMNIIMDNTTDANGYYVGTVKANLTASDNTSKVKNISYSFDGTNWNSYNGNFTLPDGQYTLYFGSYDNAGNMYNNTTTYVKVFNPTINPLPSCDRWYTDGNNITVYFTSPASGDVNYFEYSLNGGTWHSSREAGLYPIYLSTEGNISLDYRGVNDAYGYRSVVNHTWYGIDKTGPTIDISIAGAQSSSGWYDGVITVHLNAHDGGGISLTEWSWDGTNWNKYTGPFQLGKQSSKVMYFRTFDMGNRTASGNQFIYFAPGGYSQGSMSNSVWIDGQLYGPSTGPGTGGNPTGNPTYTPTSTPLPLPTPEQLPSPTPVAETSNGLSSPLAIGVLVAMLVLIVVAGIAAYLFVLKPK